MVLIAGTPAVTAGSSTQSVEMGCVEGGTSLGNEPAEPDTGPIEPELLRDADKLERSRTTATPRAPWLDDGDAVARWPVGFRDAVPSNGPREPGALLLLGDDPSEEGPSAWATPEPLANAAPNPSAKAPAPSHEYG